MGTCASKTREEPTGHKRCGASRISGKEVPHCCQRKFCPLGRSSRSGQPRGHPRQDSLQSGKPQAPIHKAHLNPSFSLKPFLPVVNMKNKVGAGESWGVRTRRSLCMRPSDQRGSAPVTSFHRHWCGTSGPKGLLSPDSDLVRVPSRGHGRPVCLCSVCSVRAAHLEAEGLELCQPQTLPGPLAGCWGWGARLLHPSPMTRRTCTAGGGGDSSGVEGDEVSGSDLPLLGWSLLHH